MNIVALQCCVSFSCMTMTSWICLFQHVYGFLSRYLFLNENCLIICFKDGSSYHCKMGWTGIFSDHTFGR